ncbi:FliO/MopB family protein [Actinoplanes subtropicus]|uniref:FliO/MopB family protein n=1 Tax=Actinoplanes subtropicus TaxID=543632 RepID=UPI0004C4762C|nr:flagellar biosynthetic protein FliO [Actinoplanes subtropicus]
MFELVLRIGFSLFVVLGLMWALARVVRRPLGGGRAHGQLAVLNRQQLTRGAAVTVVKVADRAMILGITEQQVSFLGEAELTHFEPQPERRDIDLPRAHPEATAGRLDKTLDFLRDRTSRQ